MTKSELRKIYAAKRGAISFAIRKEFSGRIADIVFASFDFATLNYLHLFIPINRLNEIDTTLILEEIWLKFPRVTTVVPRVNEETSEIESYVFKAETKLVENAWGIREPVRGEIVEPKKIDIVLLPLLCFDEKGNRVGYGKGFYDRFLGCCRPDCRKVGLSYFPPVDRIDDVSRHDVPLDYCVTATELISFA